MKKLIIAAAMFVSLSAFANETSINPKALSSFQTEFTTAQEVQWTTSTDYYRASFDMNGQKVFAYYNLDGDFMGLTRNISSSQLPVNLQNNLKTTYSKYWISDLFEVANHDGTSYYVTLEDGDKKIVLKSSNGSDWSTYKKDRKI
ncbi:MAG: hypothetical protein QM764_18175 [Chitinophagaceae bacterium]